MLCSDTSKSKYLKFATRVKSKLPNESQPLSTPKKRATVNEQQHSHTLQSKADQKAVKIPTPWVDPDFFHDFAKMPSSSSESKPETAAVKDVTMASNSEGITALRKEMQMNKFEIESRLQTETERISDLDGNIQNIKSKDLTSLQSRLHSKGK